MGGRVKYVAVAMAVTVAATVAQVVAMAVATIDVAMIVVDTE